MNSPLCFIEQRKYSKDFLLQNLNEEDITNLLVQNILEPVSLNIFQFSFVGVVSLKNTPFAVIPKTWNNAKSISHLPQITLTIKSLEQYKNSASILFSGIDFLITEPENPECSELAIAEFLIEDYQNNGIYRIDEKIYALNGEGSIDWPLTVSEIDPIFSNMQPMYIETINNQTLDSQTNLTIAIHKWSINYSADKYALFLGENDFKNKVSFYNIEIEDLPAVGFLITHLQKELHLVYTDREIRVIKALLYLVRKEAGLLKNELSLFGTRKYENIWESICKTLMKNNFKHGNLFPKPEWRILGKTFESSGTLIPDIMTQNPFTNEIYLFDAKYYSLKYSQLLTGDPSYKDILKQFQYQAHLEKATGKQISNAFLFPVNNEEFQNLRADSKIVTANEYFAVIGSIHYALFPQNKIWLIMCPLEKWQQYFIINKSLEFSEMFW